MAGFKWTRGDFCRGWLISGDTGSGKTRSGITPLLFQVFQNEPTWGGLCIDDKGLQVERRYVNTFLKMLFYTHALRRFDKPAENRRHDNLLIPLGR